MAKKSPVLRQYDARHESYQAFTTKLQSLIAEIIQAHRLQVHSISARTKTRESLERKLAGDRKYRGLSDITDLCGVRIITYFEDDVDRVASVIEEQFVTDRSNSIDKRAALDPDRFGYLSLHYVLTLRPERAELLEYKAFAEMRAEVQIRSILQHAWAEIEHDLGYKTALGVPRDIRREFSRLAGLLEIADREFTGIRTRLNAYEKAVVEAVRNTPDEVLIDKASLKAFLLYQKVVNRVDKRIASTVGAELAKFDDNFVEFYATALQHVGIVSIGELARELNACETNLIAFAKKWCENIHEWHGPITRLGGAIALLFLVYLRLGEKNDIAATKVVLDQLWFGDENNADVASEITAIVSSLNSDPRI